MLNLIHFLLPELFVYYFIKGLFRFASSERRKLWRHVCRE